MSAGTSVVQFTDTHVTATPSRGRRTDDDLRRALAALGELGIAADYLVVTGDLVDRGREAEYERFAEIMAAAPVPYYVVPGNHDDVRALRRVLPPRAWGGPHEGPIRYAIDGTALRTLALDVTRGRSAPGARIGAEGFAWLDARLAERPTTPTIVAVHQPPFRTGLHYLDVFGFRGARELRARVEAHPNVGRVICGHVHTVKSASWGRALAATAPSTGHMFVPELFERRALGVRFERPGFAVHDWTPERGFSTTVWRYDDGAGRWLASDE